MRKWWPALALVAGVTLAGSLMIERLFNRMTFQPQPGEPAAGVGMHAPVEDVYFETSDGVRLHAFYLPRPGSERIVLMFHGNFGNATQRLPFGERLAALDASVLIPDYRGYGYSEGTPSETGVYRDAEAAWRYLTEQLRYPPERIVVMGRSLGGAIGIELLTREAAAGLVLISTLRSARAMARSMGLGLLAPLVGSRLDSEGRIPAIDIPLLFFHGDEDEIVPVDHGRALFERAASPKSLHVIPQARHNDIIEVAGERFWRPLAEFLDAVAPPPAGRPGP